MPRKIDAGELLAALGGLLVLLALFLDWYGLAGGGDLPFGAAASGWEAFEALDLVLAGLALVALAVAATAFGAGWPLSPRVLVPVGGLLLAIVAIQLAEPAPLVRDLELEEGAWLALAGSLLVLLGGILRVSSISITVSTRRREVRPRVPAVDRREAAGAAPPPPAAAPPRRRSLLDDDDARGPAAGPAAGGALADPQATEPFRPVDVDK